ncbi:MAG: SpoIIE family protein phosphatase, partial [Oligoflexales bacterium]|nr:SpoIIE family protein phosphatase [Oligoflexales bacterium]
RKLTERSLYFAILVIMVAFIASILFTRRLTSALRNLYFATQKIAGGNFDVDVAIRTNDEVGSLSRSFNHMGQEIKRLMLETAEKARMEKELETAYLVQENFFPPDEMSFGNIKISAYFKPATECGGDFWNAFETDGRLIIMIGDATGHGVPAALVTAAIHSCTTVLGHIRDEVSNFRLSPSDIMKYLNASVYRAAKGKIKMTFFICEIELSSGEVRYVNASHEMPIIFHEGMESLDVLSAEPDECLGKSLDVSYREHTYLLEPGKKILFYTDGLVECRNNEGNEFSERRLRKLISEACSSTISEIRSMFLRRMEEFFKGFHNEDDITFVIASRQQ